MRSCSPTACAHLRLLGKNQVDPPRGSDVGDAAVGRITDAAGVDPLCEPFAGFGQTEFAAAVTVGNFPQPVQDMRLADPCGEKRLRLDPAEGPELFFGKKLFRS